MARAGFATLRLLLIALFSCLYALNSHAASRAALVIGNAEYRYSQPLANPLNDATDVADMLERLGFDVIRLFNGDFSKTRDAIRTFNAAVSEAEIGIVYYAGHGMELGGENWLIPVDAELKNDRDLPYESVSLKTVMESVSRASQLGLVILDSCRDNPFLAKMNRSRMTRSVERGLARVEPTRNVLVAYAPMEFKHTHEFRHPPKDQTSVNKSSLGAEPWRFPSCRPIAEATRNASTGIFASTENNSGCRSRKPVSILPAAKSDEETIRWRNSMLFLTPSNTYSDRARFMRSIAASREGAQTINFARRGSKW